MQNSRKYSFVSDIWTAHFRPNYFKKKISVGYYQIDWGEVFVILNGAIVQLPILVEVPFRDKYKLRHLITNRLLLLHVMLRQGTSWYALENTEYLLPPHLEESEL